MSPSVDAVKRLSPDRPTTRSLCLRVSGAVAPSALALVNTAPVSPAVSFQTTMKSHGFGDLASPRSAQALVSNVAYVRPVNSESPRSSIFLRVDEPIKTWQRFHGYSTTAAAVVPHGPPDRAMRAFQADFIGSCSQPFFARNWFRPKMLFCNSNPHWPISSERFKARFVG
jgi:hypothetical protein